MNRMKRGAMECWVYNAFINYFMAKQVSWGNAVKKLNFLSLLLRFYYCYFYYYYYLNENKYKTRVFFYIIQP